MIVTPNELAVIKGQLEKVLIGFAPENPAKKRIVDCKTHRPGRHVFPVPQLVLFALRDVMGFRCGGPEEKCAWWICCSFLDHPISFEMRKMGFAICYENHPDVDIERIVGQVQNAVSKVEKFLEPLAKQRAEEGHVTLANHFHECPAPKFKSSFDLVALR